ncbi:DUF6624 domain-containing protein [Phenylobacterium sp. J367]|uniref:DUF6624 domain-containing protein n=1 Tax=Phenylobacterium sp. J367 TaxID=2898435 RepID=UPI0021515B04|nr:DUF6624 domain-containing protein [Phenylobacterium sp. J367]MCR5878236.1 hypothetical protein [Phenylobacterium sp. J367]
MRLLIPLAAAAIATAALAQPAKPPFPTRPLSAEGQALAGAWRSRMDAVRAELAALPPPASLTEELARRNRLQREGRLALSRILASPPQERGWILAVVWNELALIDADNTEALRRVLPAKGWFSDPALSHEAWDIAQHTNDWDFQKEVLARVEPLAGTPIIEGGAYAKLYDRVAERDGRRQRYATQASCAAGVRSIQNVEDSDRVDALRAQVGHRETLAETRMRLKVGEPC